MPVKNPDACRPVIYGGAGRSRTALGGFAIRYITALLPRRIFDFIRKHLHGCAVEPQ